MKISNLIKYFLAMSLTTGALTAGTVARVDDLKTLYVNQRTMGSLKLGIGLIYVSKQGLNPFNVQQGIVTRGAFSAIKKDGEESSYLTSIDHLK